MGLSEKEKEHIEYLLKKYSFEKRYESLLTQIQDVLEALGILEKVRIDTDLLGQAVLNYFEDIDRLKKFEGIKRTNEDKIYSYEIFWLLRDKPIQIIADDLPYEYLYINEKVFTCILISKMMREAGISPDSTLMKTFYDTGVRIDADEFNSQGETSREYDNVVQVIKNFLRQ